MPETWMGWAQLIGTFTGATFVALILGWQGYSRLVRPLIKRFEPIVNEITGPGQEPGLRQMTSDSIAIARSGLSVGIQNSEGINLIRRDVQGIANDHAELKRDVGRLEASQKDQGVRIGALEQSHAEMRGEIRSLLIPSKAQDGEVVEESLGPASAGAGRTEIQTPLAPRSGSVSPETQRGKR